MALAKLLDSLRNKKQTAHRSGFSEYLTMVKTLADGHEIDSGDASAILSAAEKSEDDLERDVAIQQQRVAWFAQLQANRQADHDRKVAEFDLQNARAALQAAVDKLQHNVDEVQSRKQTLDQVILSTMGAESLLCDPENILDVELLEREAELNAELSTVNAELKPLLFDLAARRDSLQNAEYRVRQLRGKGDDHTAFDALGGYFNRGADVQQAEANVSDLKNQVAQLENAVQPRLREQQRLQTALAEIHNEKLLP